ncbi:agmatine deiminase family protein [Bacteroides ovatus]|nr:agmatine deiminase family protein [Bacteroides ovatus]
MPFISQVFFAWHYPNVYKEISDILVYHHIEHGTLLHTKDYWCRDYMPIQWGFKSYIQFRYEPDYLKDKPQYKTNIIPVLKAMSRDMDITQSPLIVDGGNVVVCEANSKWIGSCMRGWKPIVIMTEKVFQENSQIDQSEVLAILKENFYGADIVFLPWDKYDICGHTDGIIHNIGDGKILVNLKVYPPEIEREMRRRLSDDFAVIDLKLSKYDENSWAYINMLQTRDVIIIPGLGLPTDGEALSQIKELHPSYDGRIYQINIAPIIKKWGGALNCLSWTVTK